MLLRFTRPFARSLRAFSSLPPGISNAAAVALPRTLIAVSGQDSNKFLNGLITIRPPEVTLREPPNEGIGAYGGLLNAKGRIITDLFIYPAHDNAEIQSISAAGGASCYVLDVDTAIAEKVMDILDFHVLMMDVKLTLLSDFASYSLWNDETDIDTSHFANSLWTNDHRAPGFGLRAVLSSAPNLPSVSLDEYRLRRYLFGIPEGSQELVPSKSLPLDSCMDYMGGIDFHKGCYLGQELTIRTHHHGNVRKRVMPVVFTKTADESLPEELYVPEDLAVEPGADITDDSPVPDPASVEPIFASSPFGSSPRRGRKRPSGEVIASIGNVGLAKMRVDVLGHEFRTGELYVKPMIPFWWPKE